MQDSHGIASFINYLMPKRGYLLEVGAGTGWLAAQLANEGKEVWALEPDVAAFTILLDRARQNPGPGSLIPIPLSLDEASLDQVFDGVVAVDVFSQMSRQHQQHFLSSVKGLLKEDGLLVLNVAQGSLHELAPRNSRRLHTGIPGVTLDVVSTAEPVDRGMRVSERFIFSVPDTRPIEIECTVEVSFLTPAEISKMLAIHGLTPLALYADWRGNAYSSGSGHFVIVAAR